MLPGCPWVSPRPLRLPVRPFMTRGIPGSRRSPGEGIGYPLQYSGLENPMDCVVHGVPKTWTRLRDFHSLSHLKISGSQESRFITQTSPENRTHGIERRGTAGQPCGLCFLSLPFTQSVTLSKFLDLSMPSLLPCGRKG